jgi:hypothetical protein
VLGLESKVAGAVNHFDFRDAAGDGQIVIFDLDWLNANSIGQSQLDIVQGVNAFLKANVWSQNQLPAGSFTTAYAASPQLTPAAAAAESAVLSELDVAQGKGVTMWGGALGSSFTGATPGMLGGLVAGAHASLGSGITLGTLGGYVTSATSLAAGTQSIASQTGMLGLYGGASLGVIDLDFSLIGGLQAHESRREVVAGGGIQIARGLFTGMFIAPGAAVSVPVLSADAGDLAVTASANYVLGATAAYTETGSSANLTIGAQSINALDARLGLEGRHTIDMGDGIVADLVGRTGVFAQLNGGSATVPVTLLGQSVNVVTPGGSAIGFYAGGGIDAAITDWLSFTTDADASLRSDGRTSMSFRSGLSGSF